MFISIHSYLPGGQASSWGRRAQSLREESTSLRGLGPGAARARLTAHAPCERQRVALSLTALAWVPAPQSMKCIEYIQELGISNMLRILLREWLLNIPSHLVLSLLFQPVYENTYGTWKRDSHFQTNEKERKEMWLLKQRQTLSSVREEHLKLLKVTLLWSYLGLQIFAFVLLLNLLLNLREMEAFTEVYADDRISCVTFSKFLNVSECFLIFQISTITAAISKASCEGEWENVSNVFNTVSST